MNGLSGLNKSLAEVVLSMVMVQLKLSNLVTTDDLAAQTQRNKIPTNSHFYTSRIMSEAIAIAVNGTLMRGLQLNKNLLSVGATFVREAITEPTYRLFSIDDIHPAMMRVETGGVAIAVEVWVVPPAGLAQILLKEPPGLCIGKVSLADGVEVLGVVGESICCDRGKDITEYGGWRNYINSPN